MYGVGVDAKRCDKSFCLNVNIWRERNGEGETALKLKLLVELMVVVPKVANQSGFC